MAKAKRKSDRGPTETPLVAHAKPTEAAERFAVSLRDVPSDHRSMLALAILAFGDVALGRDPWLCFGFAGILIAWSEWKRFVNARARRVTR